MASSHWQIKSECVSHAHFIIGEQKLFLLGLGT